MEKSGSVPIVVECRRRRERHRSSNVMPSRECARRPGDVLFRVADTSVVWALD